MGKILKILSKWIIWENLKLPRALTASFLALIHTAKINFFVIFYQPLDLIDRYWGQSSIVLDTFRTCEHKKFSIVNKSLIPVTDQNFRKNSASSCSKFKTDKFLSFKHWSNLLVKNFLIHSWSRGIWTVASTERDALVVKSVAAPCQVSIYRQMPQYKQTSTRIISARKLICKFKPQ